MANKGLLMLQEGDIGSLHLKNRIFYAPMGYGLDKYGPVARKYFEARCKGGASMIFTHFSVLAGDDAPFSDGPADYENIRKMADMIHSYGAKACIQMFPGAGRPKRFLMSIMADSPLPVQAASAVPEFYYEDRLCVPYTTEEVKDQIRRFGEQTGNIKNICNYDAIEIHAYGGYLGDCFLTERWNTRTDEYGGKDIRSRAKYVLDIIASVRASVGPDFPVFVKFTPCHYIEEEGYRTIEEGVELARILEEAGVDALHVDAGCYDNWELCMPPSYQQEQTYAVRAAEQVKKAVKIPVMTAGKLGYPERGEEALRRNKCDFLVVGRGMLADPEYVNKLADGRLDDIRPCIGCDEGCIGHAVKNESMSCAVNPETGYEAFRAVPKADPPKKMLVIGAGIGGMCFAYDAKLAGHEVEIWEERARVGGLLTAAGRPSFKKEVKDLVEYFRLQLAKLGVKVVYNKAATAEEILAYGADEVILATGCVSIVPRSIPGIDGENVVTAVDALNDVATVGQKVLIVGSGLVGCETALHLASFGKTVDIIEMQSELMPVDVFIQCKNMVNKLIAKDERIHTHTGTKLVRVEKDGAVTEQDGKEVKFSCDTVILALGLRETPSSLFEELSGKVSIHTLGANTKVLEATSAARETLLDISGVDKASYTRDFTVWERQTAK